MVDKENVTYHVNLVGKVDKENKYETLYMYMVRMVDKENITYHVNLVWVVDKENSSSPGRRDRFHNPGTYSTVQYSQPEMHNWNSSCFRFPGRGSFHWGKGARNYSVRPSV